MDSIIALDLYYPIYINICLFLTLFTLLHTYLIEIDNVKNIAFINITGYTLLIALMLYIGLRPIDGIFGDTVNYNKGFLNYSNGAPITKVNDLGWHMFMKAMAAVTNIHVFFTVCAFLYIFPLYKISKTFFGEYWYYAFLMFVVSFSFWTYGVNGVRNGAACSIFLWGACYRESKLAMALFFLLATTFHKTLFLPIAAFLITFYYNHPKTYLKIWLVCIPISFVLGGVFINLFASFGFGDDRLAGYLTSTAANTGFRWDFIFYSGFAVFAGWFFVIKKKFKDPVYSQLLNTYLICNSFWILVIRANFSNRFAYLSWFMMALIIVYPLLKKQFFENQHLMIGKVMLAYFSFTYAMYYVYYA